jgi:hypothetical protein
VVAIYLLKLMKNVWYTNLVDRWYTSLDAINDAIYFQWRPNWYMW